MDPIFGLLFIASLLWAGKHVAEHVGREFRKSPAAQGGPRHAAAWWGSEARHGFPVTRSGFQSGWLAHQTAMAQYRARREEAKTSHLEARASIASELAAHKQRQADAQARIDRAGQPLLDEVAQKRTQAKERLRQAREALEANGDAERKAGVDHETERYLDLNDEVLAAEQAVKDARHLPVTQEDDQPRRFPNGNKPCDCGMPACRSGHPEDSTVPTSQNGEPSMTTATDGNYTNVLTAANTQSAQADYAAADIRQQRAAAEQILEEMQSVEVDSATLSDQADHVARLRAAEQALEAVTESGAQVSSGLGQRHGGLKEAHDDAPVRAAERGFYEE